MDTCHLSVSSPPETLLPPRSSSTPVQTNALVLPTQCTSFVQLRTAHARALRAVVQEPEFWTSLARAYSTQGFRNHALMVFVKTPHRDQYSFPLAFKLCSLLNAYFSGVSLHALLFKMGFCTDAYSINSLITFYSNYGELELARQLFDEMNNRTSSSWASMISGLDRNYEPEEAMGVFMAMLMSGFVVDEAAVTSVLAACAQCGCLEFGESVHAHAIVMGISLDSVVFGTALVDMYAKCGKLKASREVFNRMPHRNILSWSAMIGGLAMHGLAAESIYLFDEMIDAGVKPNNVTMTNILAACSHAGLVCEGLKLFNLMRDQYAVEPKIEHYGCMVDLLGRAGLLDETVELISMMHIPPTGVIWRNLLSHACMHGNLDVSKLALEQLAKLGDLVVGDYVILSNLCARYGYWEDVAKVRALMDEMATKKAAGCSSIEVNGIFHRFVKGDLMHPKARYVYEMLELVSFDMQQVPFLGEEDTLVP